MNRSGHEWKKLEDVFLGCFFAIWWMNFGKVLNLIYLLGKRFLFPGDGPGCFGKIVWHYNLPLPKHTVSYNLRV